MGEEFGTISAWWSRLRISHEVSIWTLVGAAVTGKLDRSCRVQFQNGALSTYWLLVLCWLWVRGLSASLRGPLHKLLECPHGSWLPPEGWSKKEWGRNYNVFYDQTYKSHILIFMPHSNCYKAVIKSSPHSKRGELGFAFWGEDFPIIFRHF